MLRVHFLNVGHGDCTIVRHHSGRLTMVDINTSQDYDSGSFNDVLAECTPAYTGGILGYDNQSGILGGAFSAYSAYNEALQKMNRELTDPIKFLQDYYPGEKLWRFVLTHPDLDHMRGMKRLHETIGFHNFWDTENTKPTPNYRSDDDKVDWEFYQELRQGRGQYYHRGNAHFAYALDEYGNPGGDNIEILSPTSELIKSCNNSGKSNDLSLVLRIRHAGKSVLLTGDAEEEAWEDMVNHYGSRLKSDFLKASHHGRDSGYHLKAVQHINPCLAFVSVGRKPDTDASSKYRQQCGRVASTRYHGNIELRIHDNGSHEWFVERNPG